MSKVGMSIIGGHIGGLKTDNYHLNYRPAYTKPDGQKVQARVRFSVFCNEVRDVGQSRPDNIVIWTNQPWFVWLLTKGKSISLDNMRRRSYMTRTYDNVGNVLKNPDGTDVMTKRYEFIVRNAVDDVHLGSDSQKFTAALAQKAAAEVAAGTRPADWDTLGSAGNKEWKILMWMRNHRPYEGGETFGYARVEPIPEGCTLLLTPVPADLRQQAEIAVSGGNAAPTIITGAGVVTGPGTGAGALSNIAQVEGFTMAQYLASGWTEAGLKADPKFAAFFPQTPAAPPAPPAPANLPPAPVAAETTVITGV